jgi:NADH-quinone oxidoreductase subunit H
MLHTITSTIRDWLVSLLTGWGLPNDWSSLIVDILAWATAAIIAITIMMVAALVLVYAERKVAGWIQARVGPYRVGPQGLFQTPMDAIKLLQKEDIVPLGADKVLHTLGPVLFFVASMLAWLIVPWDKSVVISQLMDQNVGILFFAGVGGITIISVLMGGWGSNNKWSLLGAVRAAAQVISYEIPMLLALLCVALQAGTLSFAGVVEDQQGVALLSWNICRPWLWLPFILFIIAMFAEVSRQPFDLPEAESELVSGYHTEYTGMKFALYFLGEYANVLVISVLAATLFLGGWLSPFGAADTLVPGVVWLFGKAAVLVFVILWVRWTLPRVRIDQLMTLAWKVLIPAGFAALLIVAVAVVAIGA